MIWDRKFKEARLIVQNDRAKPSYAGLTSQLLSGAVWEGQTCQGLPTPQSDKASLRNCKKDPKSRKILN